MKTLKQFKEEMIRYYAENPSFFKKNYKTKMGGTQTVVIEGIGRFVFDDRAYYKGRGAKYNKSVMHENLGEVFITKKEFEEIANGAARALYQMQKSRILMKRNYNKSYKNAAEIIGKKRLDEGINLVKGIKYNFPVTYQKYLEYVMRTKCIVEINDPLQVGVTLRYLEALSFRKKLLTNNLNVKKEKFYNSDTMKIIENENFEKMDFSFIDNDYKSNYNGEYSSSNFLTSLMKEIIQ